VGGTWTSSVCSGGVLGLIDDPIAQDLQESQSKLVKRHEQPKWLQQPPHGAGAVTEPSSSWDT